MKEYEVVIKTVVEGLRSIAQGVEKIAEKLEESAPNKKPKAYFDFNKVFFFDDLLDCFLNIKRLPTVIKMITINTWIHKLRSKKSRTIILQCSA